MNDFVVDDPAPASPGSNTPLFGASGNRKTNMSTEDTHYQLLQLITMTPVQPNWQKLPRNP